MVLVSFVYVDSCDPSRPGVQVLVRAPRGEVDSPRVQLEFNVPDGVSTIKGNQAALLEGEKKGGVSSERPREFNGPRRRETSRRTFLWPASVIVLRSKN